MKYLLDTHTLIWLLYDKSLLSETAQKTISKVENPIFISTSTFWEMAIKISIGKLELDHSLQEVISICKKYQLNFINITPELTESSLQLKEWHHKDPFDRMLITTAKYFDLTLITADKTIKKYTDLKTIW